MWWQTTWSRSLCYLFVSESNLFYSCTLISNEDNVTKGHLCTCIPEQLSKKYVWLDQTLHWSEALFWSGYFRCFNCFASTPSKEVQEDPNRSYQKVVAQMIRSENKAENVCVCVGLWKARRSLFQHGCRGYCPPLSVSRPPRYDWNPNWARNARWANGPTMLSASSV